MCVCVYVCGSAVCLLYFHVSHWVISTRHCHSDYAVTYARFLAPWLAGRLQWWNPKDVVTNHTSSSSFLWVTAGLSLSSSSLVLFIFLLISSKIKTAAAFLQFLEPDNPKLIEMVQVLKCRNKKSTNWITFHYFGFPLFSKTTSGCDFVSPCSL